MGVVIIIRLAGPDDARSLYDWRNDPQTRAASGSPNEIDWDQHLSWFGAVLASPRRHLMIAERTQPPGTAIGMVRVDVDDDGVGEVSINLAPEVRGQGLGGEVLASALAAFDAAQPGTDLRAAIRVVNGASIRLFETLGFVRVHENAGMYAYERTHR